MFNKFFPFSTIMFFFLFLIGLNADPSQTGKASYYADKFTGKPTASGEKYNPKLKTAAHREHPFQTLLKVTNIGNSKFVIVRVNDRGPHGNKEKIIDLSRSAAEEIDLIKAGTAQVKIEVVGKGEAGKDPDPAQFLTAKGETSPKDQGNKTATPSSKPMESKKPPVDDSSKQPPSKKTPSPDDEYDMSLDEEEDEDEATNSKEATSSSGTPSTSKTTSKKTSGYKNLKGETSTPKGIGLQLGAFNNENLAIEYGKKVEASGYAPVVIEKTISSEIEYFRVILTDVKEGNVEKKRKDLEKSGYTFHFLYKFPE